jgi:hypothetical protein
MDANNYTRPASFNDGDELRRILDRPASFNDGDELRRILDRSPRSAFIPSAQNLERIRFAQLTNNAFRSDKSGEQGTRQRSRRMSC